MSVIQTVDCRGQQCPAPILATARAARGLGEGGGLLEILADDEAFPLDLESWCRSSGAALLDLSQVAEGHRALVRIGEESPPEGRAVAAPATPAAGPAASQPQRVDCRGMECPQPILELARAARRHPGAELEVLADDDAFELDVTSWCRSARAQLVSIVRDNGVFTAIVRPAPATRPTASPSAAPASPPLEPAQAAPAPTRIGDGTTFRIDVGVVPLDRRIAELDRTVNDSSCSKLVVIAPDRAGNAELLRWCGRHKHELLSLQGNGPVVAEIALARGGLQLSSSGASTALAVVPSASALAVPGKRQATLFVLHNDKEALLAALLVATSAAAQGMDVMMFFTFWGLNLLRGDNPNGLFPKEKVHWSQRLFKWLMPKGPKRQGLGQLNFGGIGGGMLNSLMRKKNIMDLQELLAVAEEQGVRFVACTMSMNVMGINKRDFHPFSNLEYGGVASFVESAGESELSLVF